MITEVTQNEESDLEAIESLCAAAIQYGASDILVHEGKPPMLRLNGQLTVFDMPPVKGSQLEKLWEACKAVRDATDADASFVSADGTRFRVNLLRQLGQRGAVMRRIRSDIPQMESLGLPADLIKEWVARKSGIILVTGPTGSGKSTTLASALEWLNQNIARHVVTIEDPIEFVFSSKMCLFTQREVGLDTTTFTEGLRRSMRQNPDVIFLGEIRDALSASTAMRASETGHLVVATLHASSTSEVVESLELLFPANERDSIRKTLSQQLLGVMCQRLIPASGGGVALLTEYFSNFGASRKIIEEGRMPDLADFIARGDVKTCRSFLASLAGLVQEGRVSEKTAMEVSDNPQELTRMLRGISSASQASRR